MCFALAADDQPLTLLICMQDRADRLIMASNLTPHILVMHNSRQSWTSSSYTLESDSDSVAFGACFLTPSRIAILDGRRTKRSMIGSASLVRDVSLSLATMDIGIRVDQSRGQGASVETAPLTALMGSLATVGSRGERDTADLVGRLESLRLPSLASGNGLGRSGIQILDEPVVSAPAREVGETADNDFRNLVEQLGTRLESRLDAMERRQQSMEHTLQSIHALLLSTQRAINKPS
ncbi:hypothetical protein BC831DRAFT_463539 [Entophlyctis helioformis]|nr:hypothetical protein BC831DRAFT_463539 [Entophlyctis helioformis]